MRARLFSLPKPTNSRAGSPFVCAEAWTTEVQTRGRVHQSQETLISEAPRYHHLVLEAQS